VVVVELIGFKSICELCSTFGAFTRLFVVAEEIFFEVGARIAALRGAMKQSEFAERLGVNRNTVSRWEGGERLPDGSGLLRMREAFGADINVILTGQAGGVAPSLRPDEEELLAHYRQANSDGRERIRQISATAANSPKREKKELGTTFSHITQRASTPGAVQVVGSGNTVLSRTRK
jgi:transcriptional regulator with XRE-family HTH domain